MFKKRRRGDEETRSDGGYGAGAFPLIFFFVSFACFAGNSSAQDLESIRSGLNSGNTEQKRTALFQIKNLHSEAASRLAIPALSDTHEVVRATAANAVIYLPNAEAVRTLTPLLNDKSEFVRGEAAFALGAVGDTSANAALIQTLEKDKSRVVKAAAATALGKIGDTSAVSPLGEIFRAKPNEENEFLRRCAAHAIGLIAETTKKLEQTKTTPENFLPDKYKKSFSEPVAANNPMVSQMTAFRSVNLTLVKVLQNNKEADDTRREAAFALGAIGDASSVSALRSHLNSPDNYLAEICKEALLKLERLK